MAFFGIITQVKATSTGTAWVLVNGITTTRKVKIATSLDAAGDPDAYQTSSREDEVKIDCVYETATVGQVKPGDLLYVDSAYYIIEEISDYESSTDYNRAEITARRWPGNTIPDSAG